MIQIINYLKFAIIISLLNAILAISLGFPLEIIHTDICYINLLAIFSGITVGFFYPFIGVVRDIITSLFFFISIYFTSFKISAIGIGHFYLIETFIIFGMHSYLYHFMSSLFSNVNLKDNPYLKDNFTLIPIFRVKKKLADDAFNRPWLAKDFIVFLFQFRKGYKPHRKLAFYLWNIGNASYFYHNPLSEKDIVIVENFEKNQPTKIFTTTLEKLKNELEKYQIQNNIHHKIVSIKKVIKILKDLEQQMLIEKRGWSEYYLKAIRANLDEANARVQNYKLEAKSLEPITPNIYETGNPLSPNYQNRLFKGRKEVVDRLSNIIYTSQQMPLLLIQGQRRVGKTSLINYLEQLLGSGFKIVKLDMQSATNKRFNSLVQNINQELNSILGVDETIETNSDILESWIAFESYLTKHTKKLNYKIIIAFDEYEAFHKHIVKKDGEDILESMRSFIQSQNQVIFLFAGMLRLSDLTAPNWDEYFPQAQRLKVDYLSQDESYELITNPVEDFNLVYTDEVTDEVYRLTMGHPQLLQTICSIIVTIANETNQKNVAHEMVAKAKEQVFEVNEMPMTIFWREFCEDSEREVMESILANREISQETQEQKRALARLVDYGFITKDFKIRVPLFEKWLIERRDLIKII
jgi:DNA polymerase III delta prime subunit